MKIKLLIVDVEKMLLLGMDQMLNSLPDIEVVNTVLNPSEIDKEIIGKQPDIVIVSIKYLVNLDIAKEILKKFPQMKVVVLSEFNYDEYIEATQQAGVSAFVSNVRSIDDIVLTIRQVYLGYKSFPQLRYHNSRTPLTDKELEVLRLMAEDKTNVVISHELMISKRTVERHVSSIIRKLDAESRVGAVVKGIKMGILNIYV